MIKYKFNANQNRFNIQDWIKKYFTDNASKDTKAIIEIRGDLNSTVAAAICVAALGKDKVLGILMPKKSMKEMSNVYKVCSELEFKYKEIRIGSIINILNDELEYYLDTTKNTEDLLARMRMAILYAVAAKENGLVIDTVNFSQVYVGSEIKFGDLAGDIALFRNYTMTEVKMMGDSAGISEELLNIISEEYINNDNVMIPCINLDAYLRLKLIPDYKTLRDIKSMHKSNINKSKTIIAPHSLSIDVKYYP